MLFGHQNDDTAQPAGTPPPPPPATDDTNLAGAPSVNPLAVDPETGVSLPTAHEDVVAPTSTPASVVTPSGDDATTSAPQTPAEDGPAIFETTPDDPEPAASDASPATATPAGALNQEDLLTMKQQALAQLSPLVGQLEQTPEEKFRTTMMLLQSTDNPGLIRDAYAAAQAIPEEKARAQALLDVVNEINYFTQQK